MCDNQRKLTHSEAGKLGAIASKNITNWLKRQEKIVKYYSNPKKCACCGKVITYKLSTSNKYCSSSCAAVINNGLRGKKHKHVAEYNTDKSHRHLVRYCLFCGEEIPNKKKYCSLSCMIKYRNQVTRVDIQENKLVAAPRLRRFLLKEYGKCMNPHCAWDWNKFTDSSCVKLELHHIDGNSDNNVLSNVTLLCPNCHSLTDTYKAKNIGKGRAFRRQRYKEGKSY